MTSLDTHAESIFADLRRERQADIDKALKVAAQTGFTAPIIFRRVHYPTGGSLFTVGTWLRVHVNVDPDANNVYVLPPVQSAWMSNDAIVRYIVKLERLEDESANEELLKIAPFMAAEQANSDMIKILVTASTLVDKADGEKQLATAYKHDSMVLNIERSFCEEKQSWTAAACVNMALFSWFGKPKPKPDGYIKI